MGMNPQKFPDPESCLKASLQRQQAGLLPVAQAHTEIFRYLFDGSGMYD